MKINEKNPYIARQIFWIMILISIMALVGLAIDWPKYAQYQIALTVTARPTSDYLTTIAPSPTFTATLTSTPSITPTPSLPPTLAPTDTPIPSPTPIPPCEVNLDSNRVTIYPYPGQGRSVGVVGIDQSSLILYGQLGNEQWWLASKKDTLRPQGWVNISESVVNHQCSAWVKYGLEVLAKKDNLTTLLFGDDFSAFKNNWRIDDKPANYVQSTNESYLVVKPVYNKRTIIRSDNLKFPGAFSLYASLPTRSFYDKYHSYLAWRFTSASDKDSYIEVRLGSSPDAMIQEPGVGVCSLQFVKQLEGNVEELQKIPLYRCQLNSPIYLNLQFARDGDETTVSGFLNDQSIPALIIVDKNELFSKMILDIVSFGIETRIDHILVVR